MTDLHFKNQMSRLNECFPNAYKPERITLIWREVAVLQPMTFTKVIDRLIGECRTPPMLPDFRKAVSEERESFNSHEKKQHTRDAEAFMSGTSTPDEQQWICQAIRNRMQNKMDDNEWIAFVKLLNTRFPEGKSA
jgi:hypothetical protein